MLRAAPSLGTKYAGVKTTRKDLEQEGYTTIPDDEEPSRTTRSKQRQKRKSILDEESDSSIDEKEEEEEDASGILPGMEEEDSNEGMKDQMEWNGVKSRSTKEKTPSDKGMLFNPFDKGVPRNDEESDEEEESEEDFFGFGGIGDKEEELEKELEKLEEEET